MIPTHTHLSRRDAALLVLVLLLAAALRLVAPGITEFKRDEANMARLALDMAHGHSLPLLGLTSSTNIPNPPISVYLFAAPFLFSANPLLATLYVGLLNVLAVGLAWWLAQRYYGVLAATVAGVLYATSPWAVIYSRKIWAQDLLPPLIVGTVLLGMLGYGEGKRWARLAVWPLLALTVQVHYAAVVLIPLVCLIVWLALPTRRFAPRDLAIGLVLALLTLLPALAGAYRDQWLDLDRVRDALDSNNEHTATFSTTALDYAWLTVAGTDIHSLAGPEQFQNYLDQVPDAYPLFKLVPLGALLAAVGFVWRAIRARRLRTSPDVVFVAWLLLPVAVFTYEWTAVVPHYMIPLMPAAYILCGAGFTVLARAINTHRFRHAAWIAGSVLIAAIAVLQIVLYAVLLRFLDQHATPDGFGTPLHRQLTVREAVLDRQPDSVLVIGEHDRTVYFEGPSVWDVLLDPLPEVRFVNGTHTAVVPNSGSLELITYSAGLKTCEAVPCLAESPTSQQFAQRPGEAPYILRPAVDSWHNAVTNIEPVRFANNAVLTGYAVQDDAVVLAWEVSEPAQRDYQVFVHVLDANGERIAQQDRDFWPGHYWRAGDTIYVWIDLTVPTDSAALYTGMYWFGEGDILRGVEVLDANGAYLAQAVTIPLK